MTFMRKGVNLSTLIFVDRRTHPILRVIGFIGPNELLANGIGEQKSHM
jgi:hypothetical protein